MDKLTDCDLRLLKALLGVVLNTETYSIFKSDVEEVLKKIEKMKGEE